MCLELWLNYQLSIQFEVSKIKLRTLIAIGIFLVLLIFKLCNIDVILLLALNRFLGVGGHFGFRLGQFHELLVMGV